MAESCSARRRRKAGTCARRRSATLRSGRTAGGAVASRVSRWASATTHACSPKPLVPMSRGEEVDKQLVDAFSLVVMHPVRGVRQALHAVQVGYVVAFGLGEFGAEVGIALPPDDQCRRRDRAKLCCGFRLGLSYRGAVVV